MAVNEGILLEQGKQAAMSIMWIGNIGGQSGWVNESDPKKKTLTETTSSCTV